MRTMYRVLAEAGMRERRAPGIRRTSSPNSSESGLVLGL